MLSFNTGTSSVWEQFRAAGRLVNEWRDTLSYAAFTGIVAADLIFNGKIDYMYSLFPACRELGRSLSWFSSNEQRLVGDTTAPIDTRKFGFAASAGSNAACILGLTLRVGCGKLAPPEATSLLALGLICTALNTVRADGPCGVVQAYHDMWDWPRKKGDGGLTQTQRFKNGIRRAFSKIADKVAGTLPRPAPQPGYIVARSKVSLRAG